MCDCYGHKCDAEGCENVIPMHLGDYMTSRAEIKVYCDEHVSAVYGRQGIEPYCRVYAYYVPNDGYPRIDLCGVCYVTENARDHIDYNHPNAGVIRVVGDD